jgi:hypothetical protein
VEQTGVEPVYLTFTLKTLHNHVSCCVGGDPTSPFYLLYTAARYRLTLTAVDSIWLELLESDSYETASAKRFELVKCGVNICIYSFDELLTWTSYVVPRVAFFNYPAKAKP